MSAAQGYGSLLMAEAERIAREEHCSTKIAVISGVGTRHYYRKLGYTLEGPYMVKSLVGANSQSSGANSQSSGGKELPIMAAAAVPLSRRRRTVARAVAGTGR